MAQICSGRLLQHTSLPCGKRQALLLNLPQAPVTYESASGQVTVTSQHSALPLCQGTSVRPSGLFTSDRNRPVGSLMTGIPADAKPRAIRSFRVSVMSSCPTRGSLAHKAVNPSGVYHRATMTLMRNNQVIQSVMSSCPTRGSLAHKAVNPSGVYHRSNPSLKPTATLTASSSIFNPHEAIGKANSQSPLC